MAKGEWVIALVPFNYAGRLLVRNEAFKLLGLPNDERLIGLDYLKRFRARNANITKCDTCGRMFPSGHIYSNHKLLNICENGDHPITTAERAKLMNIDIGRLRDIDDSPISVDQSETMEF